MARKKLKEWLPGYKVISVRGGRYASYWCDNHAMIEYAPGCFSEPKPGCGPLAVFDTYEHAKAFCRYTGYEATIKILYCGYIPSKKKRMWFYWQNSNVQDWDKDRAYCACRPLGTKLADRVYILNNPEEYDYAYTTR